MSINFTGVNSIAIPEGTVKKITRKSDGAVLWEKPVVEDDVLFRLENPIIGAEGAYVDTGIKLFDTKKPFSIIIKFVFNTELLENSGRRCILHCMYEEYPYYGIIIEQITNPDGAVLNFSTKTNINAVSESYINDLEENVFVIVHEGLNCVLYANSIENLVTPKYSYVAIDSTLVLGAYKTVSGEYGRFFDVGNITHCTVYNRTLSTSEIQNLMSN